MQETWKDICGYNGDYQVSDYGRVRSLKGGNIKYLRPAKSPIGYEYVGLCLNGKSKIFYVHRLVAEAFVENSNIKY